MLVTHSLNLREIQKNAEKPKFLITNRNGGFLLLGKSPESRYNGLFFFIDSKMMKTIENIDIVGSEECREIVNHFNFIERIKGNVHECFFMPEKANCLVYELSRESDIMFTLDVKEAYDNREYGRYYAVEEIKNGLVFRFTKRTDTKEDSTNNAIEYDFYLVVYSDEMDYSLVRSWIPREYGDDRERNSNPFTRHVFDAARIKAKKLVFSGAFSRKKAIEEAKACYKKYSDIKNMKSDSKSFFIDDTETAMAYENAKNSLSSLTIGDGIFAGLPWFFQSWSRDEAYCLKALMKMDTGLSKKIIFKWLQQLTPSGKLPNRIPATATQCADSIGILFYRAWELIKKQELSKNDLVKVREKLEHSMYLMLKNAATDGFDQNTPQETWMDSNIQGSNRAGVRLEIQALRLAAYKTMYHLDWNHRYVSLEEELAHKVRERFFKEGILADGIGDWTVRPNIFLAAYFYPELLRKEEWLTCFEKILPKLWLNWGGLSTIDKSDYRFKPWHTGENAESYHHGDSWFFVNNIAAIVMARTDRHKFKSYIDKILRASTEEILWKGAIGHAAELSSASELKSEGCLAQAWSAATFIELVDELF
ncbi:hypothetical protein JXA85_04545 [Candidatus Woesearchaeota archaeon]|nr:hypothetical protein [Candidatus Woesearchaeota archaeon]